MNQPHPNIGVLAREEDCRVPEGAKVFELKCCENCVVSFLRVRKPLREIILDNPRPWGITIQEWQERSRIYVDTGDRYCRNCRSRMLLPPSLEEEEVYRDQLPRLGTRDGSHLPHYDSSLIDRSKQSRILRLPVKYHAKYVWHRDWKRRLLSALAERGPLSAKEIVSIVGSNSTHPSGMLTTIRETFDLRAVASEWPRVRSMGPATKLFRIVGSESEDYTRV
jgi:hypothetical protein